MRQPGRRTSKRACCSQTDPIAFRCTQERDARPRVEAVCQLQPRSQTKKKTTKKEEEEDEEVDTTRKRDDSQVAAVLSPVLRGHRGR